MAEVKDNSSIQLFEDQKIRTAWDAEKEEWYFSIIDVISVLTGTANPRRYWSDLKRKLKTEGANELYEKIVQLKMLSSDGKRYKTDVANTEQLLRIIQSIPSPKAEPFKAWLAMVGKERIEETIDPEQAIDRALDTYLKKGYSEEWIHQRLLAIRIRNELTDEWKKRGVQKGKEDVYKRQVVVNAEPLLPYTIDLFCIEHFDFFNQFIQHPGCCLLYTSRCV